MLQFDDLPDRDKAAMMHVAQTANERYGAHAGFECIVSFVRYDRLLTSLPDYPGEMAPV
jgi:hypothetical protein